MSVDGATGADAPPAINDAMTSPDAAVSADDGGSTSGTFTVLSYNVLHGFPDFAMLDQRTAMVVEWINTVQPDVILLQEIGQTPTIPNRAETLANATGYDWVFEQASGFDFVFVEGPGILSKWPIVWSEGVMLPHPGKGGFEIRKSVCADLDTPHGVITTCSAHLTTQDDETIHADQTKTAYDHAMTKAGALPLFFGGDMNALPHELSMQFLIGQSTHDGVTGTMTDAWSAANPNDDGFSAPTDDPSRRIDYVFLQQGTAGTTTISSCELILDEPDNGLLASDHIGVLCTFELP